MIVVGLVWWDEWCFGGLKLIIKFLKISNSTIKLR